MTEVIDNPVIGISNIEETITQEPTKVILFNDQLHSFGEVVNQIMKAIGCNVNDAEELTLRVHENGKGIVYSGEMVKCIEVSSILEEISLVTQIEI